MRQAPLWMTSYALRRNEIPAAVHKHVVSRRGGRPGRSTARVVTKSTESSAHAGEGFPRSYPGPHTVTTSHQAVCHALDVTTL